MHNDEYSPSAVDEDYGRPTPLDDDDEARPLRDQHGYESTSSPLPDPSIYGIPSGRRFNADGSMRGLTRRETNAEAFKQRQKAGLSRAVTKRVALTSGHFIACVH